MEHPFLTCVCCLHSFHEIITAPRAWLRSSLWLCLHCTRAVVLAAAGPWSRQPGDTRLACSALLCLSPAQVPARSISENVSCVFIHGWWISQDAHARALFRLIFSCPLSFSRFFLLCEEARGSTSHGGLSEVNVPFQVVMDCRWGVLPGANLL